MHLSRRFISATLSYCTYEEHVGAPYLRKVVSLEADKPYTITVGALGLYRIWLNGVELTKGLLAPYTSALSDIAYHDVYEIKDEVVEGDNTIVVLLGNGMRNALGGQMWNFDQAPYRGAPSISIAIECEGELVHESDLSYKAIPSHITFDDIRCGERVDMRLEREDIFSLGFEDADYPNCVYSDLSNIGESRVCNAQPIRVSERIKAVAINKVDGGYVFDFGGNYAGLPVLQVDVQSGTFIKLQGAELTYPSGDVALYNITFDKVTRPDYLQTIYYTAKEGYQRYSPSFAFFGMRYIKIEGLDVVDENTLTFDVANSDIGTTSSFECSDITLNKIYDMAIRSNLSNFWYYPLDCPHREKNGWTGDASMSAEQMLLNHDCARSLSVWLDNVIMGMREDGAMSGITPTGGWGFDWGNGPNWDIVLFNLPCMLYKYTGDRSILNKVVEPTYKYLRYASTMLNRDGLADYGLGDWLDPYLKEVSAQEPATSVEITNSLALIEILDIAIFIYQVVRDVDKERYATQMREKLVENFSQKYVRDGILIEDGVAGKLMSVSLGITDTREAIDDMIDTIGRYDDEGAHICFGIVGLRHVADAIKKAGRDRLLLEMIANETPPSIGYFVKLGFNTLPERLSWGWHYDDRGMLRCMIGSGRRQESYEWQLQEGTTVETAHTKYGETYEVNADSLNHHLLGVVTAWFIKSLAGININPTGLDIYDVALAPGFDSGLTHARASVRMPYGEISIHWRKLGKNYKVKLISPTQAKLRWDLDGYTVTEIGDGEYDIRQKR